MKKLYVVGLGPGDAAQRTGLAAEALAQAQVLCGYTGYIDLIRGEFPGKEVLATPMKQEVERCCLALEQADSGKTVAMVCSGDAGVYGMASPILEAAPRYPEVEIAVIPGVSAAMSGAALLGAPLGHDFAVISLSDLLTPWELIARRLQGVAQADMILCLYNPASHKRADYLQRACDILLEHLPGERVCGVARNIGRGGEEGRILTLEELRDYPADMFTTVFVGNSQTKHISGKMVTPRGYRQP